MGRVGWGGKGGTGWDGRDVKGETGWDGKETRLI